MLLVFFLSDALAAASQLLGTFWHYSFAQEFYTTVTAWDAALLRFGSGRPGFG